MKPEGAVKEDDPIKVYDARWEEGEFDDRSISRLFEAALIYGRRLGVDTVTICRDARLGAGRVMEIGVETSLGAGFEVVLCTDPISTPQSYFLAAQTSHRRPATMGLTVTASHNPANYIGLKLTVPTVRAVGLDSGPMGGLTEVRAIYHSTEKLPTAAAGRLRIVDPAEDYVEASLECAGIETDSLRGLPLVLDAMGGSAGSELYRALERAGAQVTALRLIPDGRFPTGAPNPTSQGKMNDAVALARERGAAVVIGVDGDGDRLVFGDGEGLLDAGFAAVAILGEDPAVSAGGPPVAVLYDPKVNPIALEAWGAFAVRPLLFRNGHSQIKDYMGKIDARFGAEESGHYYHRLRYGEIEINAENSIVTSLRFLASLGRDPQALGRLRSLQRRVYSTGEINHQFADDATVQAAMEELVGLFRAEGATIVSTTPDGIDLGGTQVSRGVNLQPGTIALERGWYSGYIRRATNEKAVLRSFFSAGESDGEHRLLEKILEVLEGKFAARQIE